MLHHCIVHVWQDVDGCNKDGLILGGLGRCLQSSHKGQGRFLCVKGLLNRHMRPWSKKAWSTRGSPGDGPWSRGSWDHHQPWTGWRSQQLLLAARPRAITASAIATTVMAVPSVAIATAAPPFALSLAIFPFVGGVCLAGRGGSEEDGIIVDNGAIGGTVHFH